MTEDPSILNCQLFQERLPEMIGSGEDLASHPHLLGCPLCRALLADLETIAEAARQLFPVAEPPDDLWRQIESALQKEEASPQADSGTGK
jgi:hypothetical protein